LEQSSTSYNLDDLSYVLPYIGENLVSLSLGRTNSEIVYAIAKYCPNLAGLYIHFSEFGEEFKDELRMLKREMRTRMKSLASLKIGEFYNGRYYQLNRDLVFPTRS
jgi:hypothetical protein